MRFKNLFNSLVLNILVFSATGLVAQSVTMSNEITMVSDNNYDLIGYFNNKITLLEDNGRSLTLHEFDDNLKNINTPTINFNYKKSRLFGYVPQDTMLTLYYKYFDDEQYIISLLNYNSRLELLGEMILQTYDKNQARPLPINISEDKSHQLIMLNEVADKTTRYIMYDAASNKVLWNTNDQGIESNLYEEDRLAKIVTNKGVVYSLYINSHNRAKNNYTIVRLDQLGYRKLEITLNTIPLSDILMEYDNDIDKLTLFGIYMDELSAMQEGILHMDVYPSLEYAADYKLIPFGRQTIIDYFGQNQRQKIGIVDLELKEVQTRMDGGHLLICEQKKEVNRINNTGRSAFVPVSTSTDYYIEDIILTSLDKAGNLEWQKVLQKKQYSYDDDAAYSSYFIHANPSHLRLMYNDEIKNENTISEYVVNPLGNVDRRVMFNTAGSGLHVQVRNGMQISSNATILPSIRKGKLRLIKVTY